MNKKNKLLCCDWGTSNFRLYLVDSQNQQILGQVIDNKGIAILNKEWKASEKQDRIPFFRQFLQKKIQELESALNHKLNGIPMILSGMSSSSIGMVEIPYTKIPFKLAQPNLGCQKIAASAIHPNDLFIFGGLCTANDVMRGEEVQLIGLQAFFPKGDCLCILPGTHSKHIWIKEETVTTFKTFMTGEIFQLLKKHSILSGSLSTELADIKDLEFFKKGVLKSGNGNILNQLFRVRTNALLKDYPPSKNLAYLSGLLIGTELKSIQHEASKLVLSGSYPLITLYETAIKALMPNKELLLISSDDLVAAIPNAHCHLYQFVK